MIFFAENKNNDEPLIRIRLIIFLVQFSIFHNENYSSLVTKTTLKINIFVIGHIA